MSVRTADSWLSPGARPRTPVKRRGDGDRPAKWGSPFVYFIALLFISICVAPVLYIVLGGFRTNAQITTSPAGLWFTAASMSWLMATMSKVSGAR